MSKILIGTFLGLTVLWFAAVSTLLYREGIIGSGMATQEAMLRCIADRAWQRQCLDQNWQSNWIDERDLILPGTEGPPTKSQHDRMCARKTLEADYSDFFDQERKHDQRLFWRRVWLLLAIYLSAPVLLLVPFLTWRLLRYFRMRQTA